MEKTEEKKLDIESLKKAGEIAKEIKRRLNDLVSVGKSFFDIAETIEGWITELGGDFAFPTNICVNEVAAHYTPISQDKKIEEDMVVKIDFGVHVAGYPVDTAATFYFGENDEVKSMIDTAKKAVEEAIKAMDVGVELSQIGDKIHDIVSERGFKTIRNLTGHSLEQYELHAGKEIPTYEGSGEIGVIEEGEAYAVEVFVTNGEGYAKAIDEIQIYSVIKRLPKRLPIRIKAARDILNFVTKKRKSLPFSLRWLKKHFDEPTIKIGISSLEQYGVLIPYPVLVEKKSGIVTQFEETVFVNKKGNIVVLTQVKSDEET